MAVHSGDGPVGQESRFDVGGALLLSITLIGIAWMLTQVREGDTRLLLPGVTRCRRARRAALFL